MARATEPPASYPWFTIGRPLCRRFVSGYAPFLPMFQAAATRVLILLFNKMGFSIVS